MVDSSRGSELGKLLHKKYNEKLKKQREMRKKDALPKKDRSLLKRPSLYDPIQVNKALIDKMLGKKQRLFDVADI